MDKEVHNHQIKVNWWGHQVDEWWPADDFGILLMKNKWGLPQFITGESQTPHGKWFCHVFVHLRRGSDQRNEYID